VTHLPRHDGRVRPATSTSPTPTATATWDMERGDRLNALVKAHPETFIGLFGSTDMGSGGTTFHVVFAPGADVEAWRDDVDAAADGAPWQPESCPITREHYDQLLAEVRDFRWPSGSTPVSPTYVDASSCKVEVYLSKRTMTAADTAAARTRWGDEVVVAGV
jgi:hypothetical protein